MCYFNLKQKEVIANKSHIFSPKTLYLQENGKSFWIFEKKDSLFFLFQKSWKRTSSSPHLTCTMSSLWKLRLPNQVEKRTNKREKKEYTQGGSKRKALKKHRNGETWSHIYNANAWLTLNTIMYSAYAPRSPLLKHSNPPHMNGIYHNIHTSFQSFGQS